MRIKPMILRKFKQPEASSNIFVKHLGSTHDNEDIKTLKETAALGIEKSIK